MEQIYIFMLFVLFVLAIFDLVVGVSNDAVNFLNSAIGSKVASIRTIMIVASIGVGVGAIFSNGMMEVAKSGIFNPDMFYFEEVMVIFVAVMLTDILLLDFFNNVGLPTSTTVSIVFELLGSAVAVASLKVLKSSGSFSQVFQYINNEKALQVITGIFVSVAIAFTVGSIVQYISRLIFTFRYQQKIKYLGGIFGGISLTALMYFLIIKGLKSVSFIDKSFLTWISENSLLILALFFVLFTAISQLLYVLKINIFRVIILTGTFALAMAFAGNDLVNFIGVPIAAWDAHSIWVSSGSPEKALTMQALKHSVSTPQVFLFLAGGIMVLTLWFSKKARSVIETGVNLSRQDEDNEQFQANGLSRAVVRFSVWLSTGVEKLIPIKISRKIDRRFEQPKEPKGKKKAPKKEEKPAFDLVRASVNLVVSSILISVGTSLKLPLSTTYVTFMVAMGSSLADRAWGRESAVYRVAGVFNVVGGWFLTAGAAFIMSSIVATILFYGEIYALIALVFLVGYLLLKNSIAYRNKQKQKATKVRHFKRDDLLTINEIVRLSSQNIAGVVKRVDSLYGDVVHYLGDENLKKLKSCKKKAKELDSDIEDLKSDIYYFIKSLDDSSLVSSKFYILNLDYLHDMVNSIGFIVDNSYTHVNNNHKKLKHNQIRNLKKIAQQMHQNFASILEILNISMYATSITKLVAEENALKEEISALIEAQIRELRSTDGSPKNTKLYFSLLLETKVLIRSVINMMTLFKDFKDQFKKVSPQQ